MTNTNSTDRAEPAAMRPGGEVSIEIDAPAVSVYDIVSDLPRTPEWSDEVTRVRWTSSPAPVVGATWKGWNRVRWIRWSRKGVVEQAERGAVFAFRTLTTAIKRDSTLWTFAMSSRGSGCRLTVSYRFLVPPGPRAQRSIAKVLPAHLDRRPDLRQTLGRIKLIAESR